uniref:Cyclin-dependent kinase inhibitor domain-containing protein n=1 Tax=Kalanchoe fedtschenkoi TaxID=63787 RepID=A0A7N0TA23_KALFE
MDASDGAETPNSKRRKVDADGVEFELQQSESSQKQAAAASESRSWISSGQSAASSSCLSNGSVEAGTNCVDLEGESVAAAEDETSPESDCSGLIRREAIEVKMSQKGAPAAESRSSLQAARRPPEAELEDFFAAAERQIQQRFIEKYNYDVVKDEPLGEGRYEWVPLKQ